MMHGPLQPLFGLCALVGIGLTGCHPAEPEPPPLAVASSTRNHLMWKRHHAVQQDLSRALELPVDALCTELSRYSCVDEVHLAGLGGHHFAQGLLAPLSEPLSTTSLSLDRVVLSACGARVERDRSDPVVFTALTLDEPAPAANAEAFTQTVQTLYRRLLGRDPVDAEYERLAELRVDDAGAPISSAEFAHLACFAVATTTEFSFF